MKLQVVFVRTVEILLFALLVLLLSSCSRCKECQLQGATETICETEFDNSHQYEDAVADKEAEGAVCTSTGGF